MADHTRARPDADRCFVCGPNNPIGLKISFRYADGICRGEFIPGENHVGFDDVTHGGIIYSVLDDVMANWLFLQQIRGVTAKCEIRYRAPLPVGKKIALSCHLKQRRRRLVELEADARRVDDESLVASATASFMIEDFGAMPIDES